MSFTYDQLKAAIQDYTENTETSFVNNLPVFIRLAEERILKNVQLSLFRKNVSGNMTASNKYLAAPTDFLAPFSLSFVDSEGDHVFLDFKDVDFFILGPTPDGAYTTELHYFYRPASLTAGSGSGTTWLSENAELTLLYGSLIEAYIYMKGEPDVMAQYEKRFVEAISALKMFGEAKEVTDQYRTGMVIRQQQ